MTQVVSVHSFRRGTGKSNLVASIAVLAAQQGQRVCLIDTYLKAPSAQILFGVRDDNFKATLYHFLTEQAPITQAVFDLSQQLNLPPGGKLFLVPAHTIFEADTLADSQFNATQADLFADGCHQLIDELDLDLLIFDVVAGITEETIRPTALCNILYIILRPDNQDYQGTSVLVEVARRLSIPRIELIANVVSPDFDPVQLKSELERAYQYPVAAVLPHAQEMLALASGGVFVLHYPEHPITLALQRVVDGLLK